MLTLTLPAGNYVATSWGTGKAGGAAPASRTSPSACFVPFTATNVVASAAPTGPTYSVSVKKLHPSRACQRPCRRTSRSRWTFINDEAFPILHEFVVLKLPPGKTAQDVVEDAKE
jgi:hypothetical protein